MHSAHWRFEGGCNGRCPLDLTQKNCFDYLINAKFGQLLIISQIVEIVATKSQILRLKWTKFYVHWASRDPLGELTALSQTLFGFKDPLQRGRWRGKEDREVGEGGGLLPLSETLNTPPIGRI